LTSSKGGQNSFCISSNILDQGGTSPKKKRGNSVVSSNITSPSAVPRLLDARDDEYGGIIIDPECLPSSANAFASILGISLSNWKLDVCYLSLHAIEFLNILRWKVCYVVKQSNNTKLLVFHSMPNAGKERSMAQDINRTIWSDSNCNKGKIISFSQQKPWEHSYVVLKKKKKKERKKRKEQVEEEQRNAFILFRAWI
jgi:hypothetical protein